MINDTATSAMRATSKNEMQDVNGGYGGAYRIFGLLGDDGSLITRDDNGNDQDFSSDFLPPC